jgi:hypothetical protein
MADDICLQILVVVEEFGLDQAPPEVIENILVGQVASEFDTEQLNVITKNVSLDTFNQFTKLLREVTRFLLPQLILIAAISYLMRGAYLLQEQRR